MASNNEKLEKLEEGAISIIEAFLLHTDVYDQAVFDVWMQIRYKVPTKAMLRLLIDSTKMLDQYSALKLASYANNYSAIFENAIKNHEKNALEFARRSCNKLDLDYEWITETCKPWLQHLMTSGAQMGMITKALITDLKAHLHCVYPDRDRVAAVDKVLSEVGLPTSTENEESWWQQLLGMPCSK